MVKIKQVNVTANYAWSPAQFYPIEIATATAAQQLDATFSTNANLSLYKVDLANPSKDLTLVGQVGIPNRFYKVIWGRGIDSDSKGLLVCGADNGLISIYDPKKLNNDNDGEAAMISSNNKHKGPVKALDFNPFQKNLYASGASESEIFIWDLNNPANPMTPGKNTGPSASISCVAWNQQVEHILGSSTSVAAGPCCVVWDLRKNAPIIKVQEPSGRMQCSEIAWHPEVATQLVLASEDDSSPVVQLWDLRFANSPLKALESHQRGIMSVAWCKQDPDLLMTCGKDNRVVCWNPNSTPSEIVYEVPSCSQWCFDVQWCPRNPAMVSVGSFDGHISIHSLMGGSSYTEMPTKQQQDVLAESFGGSAFAPAPVDQPQSPKKIVSKPIANPPKWAYKPCGASFSFGGKLVLFQNQKATKGQQQSEPASRTVTIHQVVTETEFIKRSEELQSALNSNLYSDYCQKKMESAETVFEEDLWSFLKAKFENEPRKQFLHLLGYDMNKIKSKISNLLGSDEDEKLLPKMDGVAIKDDSLGSADAFEMIAANRSAESIQSVTDNAAKPMVIPSGDNDSESLISQALLVGDYESAVNLCLREDRMADAIVLSIAGGSHLLERTQEVYFSRSTSKIGRLMLAVATKNWSEIVTTCDLGNWKEALATVLTYSNKEEMNTLCGKLGARLEMDADHKIHACLCYICSGNVEKLVSCWDSITHVKLDNKATPEVLQDLIEKVMVLRKAVEGVVGVGIGEAVAEKLANYASILASQGELKTAMGYLPNTADSEIKLLQDRLQFALGVRQQQPSHQQHGQAIHRQSSGSGRTGYTRPSQPSYPSSMQPAPTNTVGPMPARSEQASNPFRTRPKPSYAAPALSSANVYNPTVQPSSHTGSAPANGYNTGPQPSPTGYTNPMVPSSQPQVPNSYPAPPQLGNLPADGSTLLNNGGWNDPPNLDPNRIPKKKKTPVQPFQPQNYNLMTPTKQTIAAPTPFQPGVPMQPQQPSALMQPGPPQLINPTQYTAQPNGPPGAPVGNQPQPPAPSMLTASAKDVPKAPIPAEHQILQTHFEGLIERCCANASNAQTKRKLEDCKRRMEFLYDKLRANTLSPHIVSGLHQVAQFISAQDYGSGLRQHTQIVSSSNFSEISAFMPGLKSLLQIAIQLRA